MIIEPTIHEAFLKRKYVLVQVPPWLWVFGEEQAFQDLQIKVKVLLSFGMNYLQPVFFKVIPFIFCLEVLSAVTPDVASYMPATQDLGGVRKLVPKGQAESHIPINDKDLGLPVGVPYVLELADGPDV